MIINGRVLFPCHSFAESAHIEGRLASLQLAIGFPFDLIQFDVTNAHVDNYNAVSCSLPLCIDELLKAFRRLDITSYDK